MLPQLRFTFERSGVLRVLVDAVVRKAGAGGLHVALVPGGEELDGAARGGADGDVAALEVVAPRVSHYRRLRRRRREAGSRRRCDACGCPWRLGDAFMRPRRRSDQCCSYGGSGNDDARVCVAHCCACATHAFDARIARFSIYVYGLPSKAGQPTARCLHGVLAMRWRFLLSDSLSIQPANYARCSLA